MIGFLPNDRNRRRGVCRQKQEGCSVPPALVGAAQLRASGSSSSWTYTTYTEVVGPQLCSAQRYPATCATRKIVADALIRNANRNRGTYAGIW
jgi:hypothetical protein